MTRIVVSDIGGTHARFALADVADGHVARVYDEATYAVADHADISCAWRRFAKEHGGTLPRAAAFSVAAAIRPGAFKLTNNPWVIDTDNLNTQLNLDDHLLINDFVAVGHAVAQSPPSDFIHLSGPDVPLPQEGTVSIIGPGTGLGVAHLWHDKDAYRVQATEGGHIDFASLDPVEDAILADLRVKHGRVSAERVVSGPGIVAIYTTLARIDGVEAQSSSDREIWASAIAGTDPVAVKAAEQFCRSLGSVAGDITLAQGGTAVVIAGGLGLRLRDVITRSGFAERFCHKGRYGAMLAAMPVKLITCAEPGLLGAAAAYAQRIA